MPPEAGTVEQPPVTQQAPPPPPPSEAEGAAQQQQGARQTARDIAKAAIAADKAAQPAEQPAAESTETPPAAPAAPVAEATQEQVEAIAEETGLPYDEVVEGLRTLGIEVPEAPEELRPAYAKLLEHVQATVSPLIEQDEHVRMSLDELENFKQRLQEKPDDILLTVAVTKPELFRKALETFQRMEEDPEFKELVVRDLQITARERAAEARERYSGQREVVAKGRRAQQLTAAAARKHGVDPAVADQFVAAAVKEVGGAKFDLGTIDGLVARLKPRTAPPAAPKVATPAQVQRAASAPPAPPSGAPATDQGAAPDAKASDVNAQHRGGVFRSLLRGASQRLGTTTRE